MCLDILSWSIDTLSDMSHCGTYECALTESFVTLDIICVWTSCPEPLTHIFLRHESLWDIISVP